MTSPQTLVPEIRFEGFSSAWEQRRLSELANFSRGNGLSWADVRADGANECILYGNLYTDYGMIADSVKYRTNTMPSNPSFSQYGDVLIPGSDTTPTGLARATSIEKSGVLLGGDINILRPTEKVDGSCLSIAINANKAELIKLIKGITVRHIHNDDIKDVEIAFPVAKDEQRKLVGVFKTIDYLISLQQRKQNQLKNVKKSMLEKMFPRDGANVPEIRFAGFTNAWEQRKVTELLKNTSDAIKIGPFGSALKKSFFTDKGIKVYAQENAFSGDFSIGNYYISEAKYNELKSCELKPGDLVISMMGTVGACAIFPENAEKGIMNSHLLRLQFSEEVLPEYIMFLLRDSQIIRDQIDRLSVGSIMTGLSSTVVKKLVFPVPKRPEQQKIVELLKQLDNFITLHQCKCDKLKDLKNSLLQKMFV